MVDGLDRQVQPLGEFGIGEPVVEQAQHLDLTGGQARRIGQRRRTPARGHRGDPLRAEIAADFRSDGVGAQSVENVERTCRERGVAGVDERERGVVRHRKTVELICCRLIRPIEEQPVRLGHADHVDVFAEPSEPDSQLATGPLQACDGSVGQQFAALGYPVVGYACSPGKLDDRRRNGQHAYRFGEPARQSPRVVEGVRSRAVPAQRHQRRE